MKIKLLIFFGLLVVILLSLNDQRTFATTQTFSAGVIAADPPFVGQVKILGQYKVCRVIAAIKEDQQRSACYLYQDEQKNWLIESFGAICQTKCR